MQRSTRQPAAVPDPSPNQLLLVFLLGVLLCLVSPVMAVCASVGFFAGLLLWSGLELLLAAYNRNRDHLARFFRFALLGFCAAVAGLFFYLLGGV